MNGIKFIKIFQRIAKLFVFYNVDTQCPVSKITHQLTLQWRQNVNQVFVDLPSIFQDKFDIEFPKIGYKNIFPNYIYRTILLLNYTNNRQKHSTFFPDADNVGETGVSW